MKILERILPLLCSALPLLTACNADEQQATEPIAAQQLHFDCTVENSTRGIPLEALEDSFALSIYAYEAWDEATTLPVFYNEKVVNDEGDWHTVNLLVKPSDDKMVRYYAWYPMGHDEVAVSSTETTAGRPQLTITVPDAITDQQDVMYATQGTDDSKMVTDYYGAIPTKVPLQFHHLLTQVRFVTGTISAGAGIVKSITLSNVKNKGTFTFDSDRPANLSGAASYTLTLNKAVTGAAGEVLELPDGEYPMLMPQDPTTVKISIVFSQNDRDYTLSTTLPDVYDWNPGKIITYTLHLNRSEIRLLAQVTPWDESPAVVNEKITY